MISTDLSDLLDELQRKAATAPDDRPRSFVARRRGLLEAAAPRVTPEDVDRLAADTQDNTGAIQFVRRWLGRVGVPEDHVGPYPVAPHPRVLVLMGGVGCGKSVAAAYALAREPGFYVTPSTLADAQRSASWRDDRWHRWTGCRLLVLDDLGTETGDDFASTLFELIDRRATSRRSLTVITTNLTRQHLVQRYDARIQDRLGQHGALVPIADRSMRQGVERLKGDAPRTDSRGRPALRLVQPHQPDDTGTRPARTGTEAGRRTRT